MSEDVILQCPVCGQPVPPAGTPTRTSTGPVCDKCEDEKSSRKSTMKPRKG